MRVLRTLPLLLGLHFICTHGITAPVGNDRNLAGLRSSAPPLRDNEHGTSRQRPQHLTPSQSCKEEEAALDCKRLLASLARAGGVKGKDMFKGKEGGWLPDALQQFSAAKRVVAVNAVSWAAVVGGTVLWSRNKMISDGGAVRKALVGAVVSSSSVQVASNVLRAVSGNVDGANGGNDKEPSAGILGAGLKRLRWSYLGVLAVCYLGEHTRGAYSFKTISQHHDLKPEKMLNLQVATLTSSMITALFCGSFLDRYGRRYGCMLWAVLNILQSILIRSKALFGVFLSSVIAGVGGALIRTAFEAWMVTEHRNRGYPSILLGDSFHMATWAMGLTPVASAFVAKVSVEKMKMGYLAPDNVAIGVSMMSLVLIGRFWKENFGERSFGGFQHTQRALSTIVTDSRLWMMGLVQTLFESSMFVFVFLWSTAPTEMGVTSTAAFSAMMISLCGGSSLFKLMARDLPLQFAFSSEACLVLATGVSTLVFAASSMAVAPNKTDQTSTGKLLLTFLLYHACMGLYFPAMATCRSEYIGDRQRGTVMNILRVPMYLLSAIVVSPLGVRRLPKENLHASMFGILASFTGVATLVQVLLLQRENQRAVASSGPPSMALPSKEKRGREVGRAVLDRDMDKASFETNNRIAAHAPSAKSMGHLFSLPKTVSLGPSVCLAVSKSATVPARMLGRASAGWRMASSPPGPSTNCKAPSFKVATREVFEDLTTGRPTRMAAFLSLFNPARSDGDGRNKNFDGNKGSKEWTTWRCFPAEGGAAALLASSTVSSLQFAVIRLKTMFKESMEKEEKGAKTKPSSSSKPATSSAPASSASASSAKAKEPTKARGANSHQPQSRQSPSNETAALARTGEAENGKMATLLSTIAGGMAAAGWFLCRASASSATSTHSPHGKNERWPGVLGEVPPGVITADGDQHPSWQTTIDGHTANDKDRDEDGLDDNHPSKMHSGRADGVPREGTGNGSGRSESKGRRKTVQHSDTQGMASNSDREAGVWVGWGGGCAF